MNDNVFGNRLRMLLEEREIEGKEFAKLLHVQPPTLSNWLNGNRFPKDREILTKISNHLNVSLDYLLGKSDTRNPESQGVKLAKQENFEFDNPQDALKFILGQPSMMDYGGYDLSEMPEEEILEIANDMLLSLRISIERRKNRTKGE